MTVYKKDSEGQIVKLYILSKVEMNTIALDPAASPATPLSRDVPLSYHKRADPCLLTLPHKFRRLLIDISANANTLFHLISTL
jgi:hypothetical protein